MIIFMHTCDKTWFLMVSESFMKRGLCYCYVFLSEKCHLPNTNSSLSKNLIISNATLKGNETWTEGPLVITTSG